MILNRDSAFDDRDIRAIENDVESIKYVLDPNDADSTKLWADKLAETGELLFYNHEGENFLSFDSMHLVG